MDPQKARITFNYSGVPGSVHEQVISSRSSSYTFAKPHSIREPFVNSSSYYQNILVTPAPKQSADMGYNKVSSQMDPLNISPIAIINSKPRNYQSEIESSHYRLESMPNASE